MTKQIPDQVIWGDRTFLIAGIKDDTLLTPREFGIMVLTGGFTACARGYASTYSLIDNQLALTEMVIYHTKDDIYPPIEGTEAELHYIRSRLIFASYSSLHVQTHVGSVSNVNLLVGDTWTLPKNLENMLIPDREIDQGDIPPLLTCSKVRSDYSMDDFVIASQMKMDARALPSKISESLFLRGWDIDPKKVSSFLRRVQNHKTILPYIIFALSKLSSNFCFEICDRS